MTKPFMYNRVVCFDLDDTLYKEIDYVASAFCEIASYVGHPELKSLMMTWYKAGNNVFNQLNEYLDADWPFVEFQRIYRNHFPSIELSDGVEITLNELVNKGAVLGLITDGRSVSQRNKINALDLGRWFENDNIIISEEFGSEKTNKRNFNFFKGKYPKALFSYVGDNPQKDFVVPNMLRWKTIMLKDDGRNIHKQETSDDVFSPQIIISEINDLLKIL